MAEQMYFQWLLTKVGAQQRYMMVLKRLFQTDFESEAITPMDDNRIADGLELRYRFGEENNIDQRIIASQIDYRPCSLLEVMVSLALNAELIMMNTDKGDRTAKWFNDMLISSGLIHYTNLTYNEAAVDTIIFNIVTRNYAPNGKGGLFTISATENNSDMRTAELWYQLMWYLDDEIYRKGEN